MPTYKDINLLTQKSAIVGAEKLPVSDTEFITPRQITAGVREIIGFYKNDPDYIYTVVDKDFRILFGVKADGGFVFGEGVPTQVKDYVDSVVGDIETLLAAI